MRLTEKQVKALPDGTQLKIFLSGTEWNEDFGKAYDVIKIKDKLCIWNNDFFDINDINAKDGYELEVAQK